MTINRRFSIFIIIICLVCIGVSLSVVTINANRLINRKEHDALRASNNAYRIFFEEFIKLNSNIFTYASTNIDIMDAVSEGHRIMSFISQRGAEDELVKIKTENPQIIYISLLKTGKHVAGDNLSDTTTSFLQLPDENSLMRLSIPVSGSNEAEIVGYIDLAALVTKDLKSIRLTDETHFYLYDKDIEYLHLHSNPDILSSDLGSFFRSRQFTKATSQDGIHLYQLNNQERIAYTTINENLVFGVSIPYSSFILTSSSFLQLSIIIALIAVIAAVLAGAFAAKNLTKPLRKMSETVQKISQHQYDSLIKVDTDDELAVVSRAINSMALEIKQYTNNLEDIVSQRTSQLQETLKELKRLSITDPLTDLFNRQKFEEVLGLEIRRAKRANQTFSLVYFDLDHFKNINDTYGHLKGDEVLVKTANICKNTIRSTDIAARWGGEEFVIVLPDTNIHGAMKLAEKIRSQLELHKYPEMGAVTGSFGCTQCHEDDDEKSILHRCDEALYESKENGRNRITLL